MMTQRFLPTYMLMAVITSSCAAAELSVTVEQITHGPKNHFFGYIGHVQNTPWSGDGRYLVALRTTFQDRMPGPGDPADVILIDRHKNNEVRVVDQSRGWNPQQGTMLYWNPDAPDSQFFFNDRDTQTGKVFCVLFDVKRGRRVTEYRFNDSPVGNSGVAQNGGKFLAINYARMARLRPVTGYRDAYDWTKDHAHPADDGIFVIGVDSRKKQLLVSFRQLAARLRVLHPEADISALFINHTLWNREDDRIFFFARCGWSGNPGTKINQPFVMHADGSNLKPLAVHIGGHPEWDYGHRLIGSLNGRQVVYDANRDLVVGRLGSPEIFPKPEGDVALSPNGGWFVNGYKDREAGKTFYTILRRRDGAHIRTAGFDIGNWLSGDLRLDPAPCWSRDNTQIAVPGLAKDGKSRQMFVVTIGK